MKKFAVGVIDFYTYKLKIEIIEAETEYEALIQHSKIEVNWLKELSSKSIEDAKEELFDYEIEICIEEIR